MDNIARAIAARACYGKPYDSKPYYSKPYYSNGYCAILRQVAVESERTPLMHDEAEPSVKAVFTACGDRDGDVYLVKAEGELDAGTEDVLADELNRAVATDAKHILLDLSDVTFIDSTGLDLLVRTNRRVAAGRLRLVPVEGQVRRVLELTGVAGYLEFVSGQSTGDRRWSRGE